MRRALAEAGSETTFTADAQTTTHESENGALHLQLASLSAQLLAAEEAIAFFRGLYLTESRARMLAVQLAKSALHAAADRQGQAANRQVQSADGQGQSANRHSQSLRAGHGHSSAVTQHSLEADEVESPAIAQCTSPAHNVEASETDSIDSPATALHAADSDHSSAAVKRNAVADSDHIAATVQSFALATHSTADVGIATAQFSIPAEFKAKSDLAAAATAAHTPRQSSDNYRPLQSSTPAKSEGAASFAYPSQGDKTSRTETETDMIQIPALHLQSNDLQRLQRELNIKDDTIQEQRRQITEHAVKLSGQKVLLQQLKAKVQAWELPALLFDTGVLPTKVSLLLSLLDNEMLLLLLLLCYCCSAAAFGILCSDLRSFLLCLR